MNIFKSTQYEFKTSLGNRFMHKIALETIKNKFQTLIAVFPKTSYFSMIIRSSNLINCQITSTSLQYVKRLHCF